MLIAILVLLGIAGAIWYFARKQQSHTVSLTAEQTAELNRQTDRNTAVKSTPSVSSPSVEQINTALSVDESTFTTPEVAAEKAFIQEQQDALAKAQELAAAEVKSTLVETPVNEAPKPAKKKRRYYPKKK
jgi:cytoskeletal protein RodZ